jgi:hypothetical protein
VLNCEKPLEDLENIHRKQLQVSRIRLFSIPDPNCLHPGSWISDPHQSIKVKNEKRLNSRNYDPVCSSRIRIRNTGTYMLRHAYLSTQRCLFFGRKQALQLPQREAEQNSQSFCLHRRRILFPGDLKY